MNISTIAEKLNMDQGSLLVEINRLNTSYDLGISDNYNLTNIQYNIIRASMDTRYLVTLLGATPSNQKNNYNNSHDYVAIMEWVGDYDLNNYSTKDIKHSLPSHISNKSQQAIASVMKSSGYESRVVILDNGKQGRRWFNYIPDVKSIVNTNTKDAEDATFYEWAKDKDFEGLSSKEVDDLSPINRGKLKMGSLMRAIGYENRRVYLDKYGKQGRRWFKKYTPVSFL